MPPAHNSRSIRYRSESADAKRSTESFTDIVPVRPHPSALLRGSTVGEGGAQTLESVSHVALRVVPRVNSRLGNLSVN